MTVFEVAAIILFATAVVALLNRRFLHWPETIGVMAISMVFSFLILALSPFLPEFVEKTCSSVAKFDFSEFVLEVALSFLIFAGAFSVDIKALTRERIPVLIFATLGILVSTAVVGFASWWLIGLFGIEGIRIIDCLVFGALISPTDPVAVLAILQKAGVSEDLNADITGESLLNDGVAVVLFTVLTHLATGQEQMGVPEVSILLGKEVGGGVLLGIVIAILGRFALKLGHDPFLDVLVTLGLVVGGYAMASSMEFSGPLAMVVSGLWLGTVVRSREIGPDEKQHITIFWEVLDRVFNMVIFVLLGVVFVGLFHEWELRFLPLGGLIILVVLIARALSLSLTIPMTPLRNSKPLAKITLLTWGGLRGAVSVALALSLLHEQWRDLFFQLTYIVVVFSVLVQGLTVGRVARKLGFGR
ncbi:MAG: sodium:proton antiporter [Verrucomicrobiales bacterium]|nr:sodium:proton antiporter [Verrucomicrobiales bacterium]